LLIQHGLLETLDCPVTCNISFIITILITVLPLFTDVQLPFSHVYYISLLLYNDSESGSGDTQSSSCRSSQLRAHAPSILHLHPVFFIPCPVTIVTIHSANSTIVHSGSIIQGVHVMTCLLFIKICIHAFFSLSSSLFVLSHRMVRKHNPSHKLMLTGTGSFLILHLRHYVR